MLSVLQGKINQMGAAQLKRELQARGKSQDGEVKVLRARLKHQEVLGEFQRYVRPTHNPVLSPFCTRLTGITQADVDGAEPFPVVFAAMLAWLRGLGLLPGTVGDGDSGDGGSTHNAASADAPNAAEAAEAAETAPSTISPSEQPECIFATD
eukprot:gene11493-4055_t